MGINKIQNLDLIIQKHIGLNYRKYLFGTVSLIIERAFRLFINLFVTAWVARCLGPSNFGSLNYTLSIVAIYLVLTKFGIDQLLTKSLTENKIEAKKLISNAIFLKVGGSLIILPLFLLIIQPLEKNDTEILLISVLGIGSAFRAFEVLESYYYANNLAKKIAYSQALQSLIVNTAKLILVYYKCELFYIGLVYILEYLLYGFFLNLFLKESQFNLKVLDLKLILKFLKEGLPLLMTGLATTLYSRVDQIMIQQILESSETGNYAAAVRIHEAWLFIPIYICNSLFPSIFRGYAQKQDQRKKLIKLYALLFTLTTVASLFFLQFSNVVIELIYESKYIQSTQILQILSFSSVFFAVNLITNRNDILHEQNYRILSRSVVGMLTNIILNLYLIEIYGVTGAAIATLITLFIVSVVGVMHSVFVSEKCTSCS